MATTRPLSEILPKEMTELKVRPIFTLLLEVQPAINVGKTPGVDRRVGVITGGRFEGERLRGTLLPGGSDWQAIRPGDGAWLLNVRIVLKTDDDAIIGMSYPGLRHGPKEVLDRIARGEVVKATDYYLRISATFETASEKYGWLNNIISVGVGHRLPEGPIYQMFEVLVGRWRRQIRRGYQRAHDPPRSRGRGEHGPLPPTVLTVPWADCAVPFPKKEGCGRGSADFEKQS